MTHQPQGSTGFKLYIRLVLRLSAFAGAILWPSGSWAWWEGWTVIALWVGFALTTTVFLARHDPALLAERMKASPVQEGQKTWDKILMLAMIVPGLASYILPGFDVIRYGWSAPFPVWVELLAMAAHLPCFAAILWVMRENTYLMRVVKIDKERGHKVITTGPYAIVRHPMYTAAIVLVFAFPVALGSRFALIPAAVTAAMLIVRTILEDRTLHAELRGYTDYASKTRYRLIPLLW